MAEVVARDEKFVREWEPREQGLAHFRAENDFMKVHFVEASRTMERQSRSIATALSWISAADRTFLRRDG